MILKNCNFKKGIGIESQKNYAKNLKNYRNKMELNGCYRTNVNCT